MKPQPPRAICKCFKLTGDRDRDNFVLGHENGATCAALFSAALGPWESPQHLAIDALRQLSAELSVFSSAFNDDHDAGDLDNDEIRRVLAGMSNRAKVAAEVEERIRFSGEPEASPESEAVDDDDPMYGAALDLRMAADTVERVWDNKRAAGADETLAALQEVKRRWHAAIEQLGVATKSVVVEADE